MRYLLFFLLLTSESTASSLWDEIRFTGLTPGKSYDIDIGTGFFVNDEMIVTNRHVVTDCLNIAVRGAVQPQLAKIYATDEKLDLALLKTTSSPHKVPYLRNNFQEVKVGDILFSIGYPLEHGNSGDYVIKQASVTATLLDKKSNFNMIEFTDSVGLGNSGGPLLDKNSNLVGVVTAKLTYYVPDHPEIKPKTVAEAIGVEGLIEFLKRNNIPYAASSTYDIFTNYHVDQLTRHYVVNIHCIKQPSNKN